MTSYNVKLFTFDARMKSLELLAEDVLGAAAAAVPYFIKLGEHVQCATAIVVERGDSSFALFTPRDVLTWLHRRESLRGAGTDSAGNQPSGESDHRS